MWMGRCMRSLVWFKTKENCEIKTHDPNSWYSTLKVELTLNFSLSVLEKTRKFQFEPFFGENFENPFHNFRHCMNISFYLNYATVRVRVHATMLT